MKATADWAGALRKATAAYNDRSHSYLMGSAPHEVKGSNLLQYELDKLHGEQIKHNNDKWRAKARRLWDASAFRVPRPRDMWERIDAPKFSGEAHEVVDFKRANVGDSTNSYRIKTALAVPRGSADIDIGIETGPGGGRRARRREMLQEARRREVGKAARNAPRLREGFEGHAP